MHRTGTNPAVSPGRPLFRSAACVVAHVRATSGGSLSSAPSPSRAGAGGGGQARFGGRFSASVSSAGARGRALGGAPWGSPTVDPSHGVRGGGRSPGPLCRGTMRLTAHALGSGGGRSDKAGSAGGRGMLVTAPGWAHKSSAVAEQCGVILLATRQDKRRVAAKPCDKVPARQPPASTGIDTKAAVVTDTTTQPMPPRNRRQPRGDIHIVTRTFSHTSTP